MTRTYSLLIEGDGNSYSAHLPELSTIVVTGDSVDDVMARAKEAVRIYWQSLEIDRSPSSILREIEVDLPD